MSSEAATAPEPSTVVYRSRGNHGKLHADPDCIHFFRTPDERIQEKELAVFPDPDFCPDCCPEGWFE